MQRLQVNDVRRRVRWLVKQVVRQLGDREDEDAVEEQLQGETSWRAGSRVMGFVVQMQGPSGLSGSGEGLGELCEGCGQGFVACGSELALLT